VLFSDAEPDCLSDFICLRVCVSRFNREYSSKSLTCGSSQCCKSMAGHGTKTTYNIEQGVAAQSDGTDQLGAQSAVRLLLKALGAAQDTMLQNACQSRLNVTRDDQRCTRMDSQSMPCVEVNRAASEHLQKKYWKRTYWEIGQHVSTSLGNKGSRTKWASQLM